MRPARRILILSAAVAAGIGLLAFAVRLSGPRVSPLPSGLPRIVRQPPPSGATFPAARLAPDPGSDIRRLHARGISGRHVGIAIIDRPLLTSHREFADRLRWYDEIDTEVDEPAGLHSTAVASIAAGRSVGAAPGADLYFVGVGMNWAREPLGSWWVAARRAVHADQTLPLAIHRILEFNRRLPAERRIRVLSLSVGGGRALERAVDDARREGLFVSWSDLRLPRMGPITIANPAGPDAYTTHETPAGSWAIAHMAGRYALACEDDPGLTPDRFMRQQRIGITR